MDMFKSLIGLEPKFRARAFVAICFLSMLRITHGYAAEKPGDDQQNLKREDIKRAESRSGEREKPSLKTETKRGEQDKPSLKLETTRGEREKPSLKTETKRGEQEKPSLKMQTTRSEADNPKLKMETKGAGSAMALPKPAAAHWDASPQNKR